MADREITLEAASDVAPKFDEIFERHFEVQRKAQGGRESLRFPRYRALKDAFGELAKQALANNEIRELVDHVIKDGRYADVFREWIGVQNGSWDSSFLSRNLRRIYSLGRNRLRDTG